MIIWRGFGFLVLFLAFVCALAANLIANAVTGSGVYWEAHRWPLALALLVAGTACWFLGQVLRRRPARTWIDKETGAEFVHRPVHSLFFVEMHLRGPILAIIALFLLIQELVK